MKEDRERDKIDRLFHDQLYDYEVEVDSSDWEEIAGRLPVPVVLPLRRRLYYVVAAAALLLLLLLPTYWLWQQSDSLPEMAEIPSQPSSSVTLRKNQPVFASVDPQVTSPSSLSVPKAMARVLPSVNLQEKRLDLPVLQGKSVSLPTPQPKKEISVRTASAPVAAVQPKPHKTRRWGVGMGASAVSVGSDNVVPFYVMSSPALRSESLMLMNASYWNQDLPKTDIQHKTPVSFGVSVSYRLNNRWALQSGLNYTYLSSSWTTNGVYQGKTKQKLHFIGLPLSVTYKIAEWQRVSFYASAGGMTEVNVAGKQSTQLLNAGEEITRQNERVRMKEWLWSVNGHVGAAYPLCRFLNAFAEVGASYYFDNGSSIETVRRERPFNVDVQLGLRLGF
ncbi:MAG: porin family protein [Parabacteroides sp.]